MIYVTGDTHGDFSRYLDFSAREKPTKADVMIVLGDAGLNYYGGKEDEARKEFVNGFPFTTFCIHGNHEMRPSDLAGYISKEYRGGLVRYEEKYPNLLFAEDGEIYDFDGRECIVIGGAYSVDKYFRLAKGWRWFENEQPSEEIKVRVEKQLEKRNFKIDTVLSHTCPLRYEPTEVFLSGLDQSTVDQSTEEWLGKIEAALDYREWLCGHFHTTKTIDKMRFLFQGVEVL